MPSRLGGFYGFEVGKPALWPPKGEGRQGAVFWFRWWHGRLHVEGMTVAGASSLHRATLRELQSGERQALAIHPDSGHEHPIPAEFWQGRGEAVRTCLWTGQWWTDDDVDTPHELFMIEDDVRPDWWPGARQSLKSWCAPDGPADRRAREALKTRGQTARTERAVCAELFAMWRESGREGSSPKSIETARIRMR